MKRYILILFLGIQNTPILSLCQALFAPGDDITARFVERIMAEEKSIHGAIYMLTDKKITLALIDAHKRGVDVQLILDQISMCNCGKGKMLQEQGVPVFVHRTQEFNPYTMPLMHHKFFIFGCNKEKSSIVWTGSWNCTVRGSSYNNENVIIVDDHAIVKQFSDTFLLIKNKLAIS